MSKFTIQCREVSNNENCKMKLFPSSSTGQAFAWYSSLPPNSINSWAELEDKFQTHFSHTDLRVSIVDLARLRQRPDENVEQFIMRFKRARMRCQIVLPEREYVKFVADDLDFEFRKKFEGVTFFDLYELSDRASRYESLIKEERNRNNSTCGTYFHDPNYEVDIAEFIGHNPQICDVLDKKNIKTKSAYKLSALIRDYSFDIKKSGEIFDWLLEAKLIKLVGRHKIPTKEETHGRDYCKWHNAFTHQTKDCVTFRNVIQEKIERGILKFLEKPKEQMKADIDPFLHLHDLNMISADFESLISSFKNDKNSKCNVYQCVNV